MSSWVVIPCLLTLRDEFNQVSPNRDKGADGTIGDSSHTSTSDHTPDEDSDALRGKDSDSKNEVHALDIDSSGPWPYSGWFDEKIEQIVAEEKRRWNDPNDMCRLNYVIRNGRIADKDNNWAWMPYNGSDPHTNHVHFSARYETQAENDTRPWGVAEDDMTKDEFMAWSKEFHAQTNNGFATWQINGIGGAGPSYQVLADTAGRTNIIKANTEKILAALGDLAGKDFTDEQAIINGVLAGLAGADGAAETIANAVVAALPPDLASEVVAEMGRLLSAAPPADAG